MNIVMMTNTYLPHVGGVARSVESFREALTRRGHRVLVIAPTFEGMPDREEQVVRVPALQNFNGSDFSVRLPVPGIASHALDEFEPQLIHAHHPFLLGDTALRVAARRDLPMVFTHHTMYERYTHYVPGDSPQMRRFVIRLAKEYANLCDRVIAPSESIAAILRERGVEVPITAIPTGIDPRRFAAGDGAAARRRWDLGEDTFVVGHVGRLAPEKNLSFLARAVAGFLRSEPNARFLVVGDGPAERDLDTICKQEGVADRLHRTGSLSGSDLADAYHAMDAFAFASHTETQGMVLAEAMTARVPVVALDAPGAREVVEDGENGRLLLEEDEDAFADALAGIAGQDASQREAMREAAGRTAERFSLDRCTERLESLYAELIEAGGGERTVEENPWARTLRLVETEWNLWGARAEAAAWSLSHWS